MQGEASIKRGNVDKVRLEGVGIISTVSIADISFEPDLNYVTEALRLNNFMFHGSETEESA